MSQKSGHYWLRQSLVTFGAKQLDCELSSRSLAASRSRAHSAHTVANPNPKFEKEEGAGRLQHDLKKKVIYARQTTPVKVFLFFYWAAGFDLRWAFERFRTPHRTSPSTFRNFGRPPITRLKLPGPKSNCQVCCVPVNDLRIFEHYKSEEPGEPESLFQNSGERKKAMKKSRRAGSHNIEPLAVANGSWHSITSEKPLFHAN